MLLKILGLFFVALAVLGAALPVLPTTPFLILAASCFAKSSPRLHKKLLDNRVFGPLIRDWHDHRSIPKKGKVIAIISMIAAVSWSCYVLDNIYLQLMMVLLVSWPLYFIIKLPLTEDVILTQTVKDNS